jgi:uncharacterized membrane protein
MAKDMGDAVRSALGNAVREAAKNAGGMTPKPKKNGGGPLSGARGLVAGAGLAAAAPLAKKGVDAVRSGGLSAASPTRAAGKLATKAGDKVASNVKDVVGDKVEQAGGAGGIAKEAASGLLPGIGGGDGGGGKGGMPGVGKGRRMPVQQAVDVAVPIETAYNQFTQFEDWPEFMHRVTRVTQEDDCTINFATKIWGKTKEFTASIETQRPDERIKWRVSQGITHSGVVTFHELAPRLTRIEVSLDVDPGSLIEKAARGMRHVKRAVRADLHRYKAFIEMQELETGAWRGVIEDGELVEPHDDSYDEERDYSDIDELREEAEAASGDDDEEAGEDGGDEDGGDEDGGDEDDEPTPVEELPRDKSGRFSKGAGAKPMAKRSSSRATSGSSGNGNGNGSGGGRAKTRSSGSSSSQRTPSSRKRGATNGSGSSSSKRSSSSTRRRSSSRS